MRFEGWRRIDHPVRDFGTGPFLDVAATPPHEEGTTTPHLLLRFDSEKRALVFFRQDVEKTVGPLPDVAYSLVQFSEHRFTAKLFGLFVEDNTLELAGS